MISGILQRGRAVPSHGGRTNDDRGRGRILPGKHSINKSPIEVCLGNSKYKHTSYDIRMGKGYITLMINSIRICEIARR